MVGVFCCSCAIDYAHVRYAHERDAGEAHAAARWSVVQWLAATVGFVVAVRVSLWVLPAEALGLYAGTWLGVRRKTKTPRVRVPRARMPPTCKSEFLD